MPIEFHDMEHEPPTTKLKLGIVGKEKHGKSWLAATGRKPILVNDFDNRAEALNGKEGVYVISYVDPQWPNQPDAAQLFLTVLDRLEHSLDLYELRDLFPPSVRDKIPKETIIRTNVIDSVQTLGQAFQRYALFGVRDIRRELTIGKTKVFLPGGWDAWNTEMISVENTVLRLLALPTDTIIVYHETLEETEDSTSEKPKYTGKIGVFPVRYQRLIKYLNELWRVHLTQVIKDGKSTFQPKVYPLPNFEFDGATAMLLDAQEEPNITALIAKHEQKLLAAGKGPKSLADKPTKLIDLQTRR